MNSEFKIIADHISGASHAPKGKGIFYRCMLCGDLVPSIPKDNIGCKCDNIFIDIDSFRLVVKDFSKFQAVQNMKA